MNAEFKVIDIINLALKQLGVGVQGNSPSQSDINDTFNIMKMMIGSFERQSFFIYTKEDYFGMSSSKPYLTVGVGGDIDPGFRPDKISSAYARLIMRPDNISTKGEFDASQFSPEFDIGHDALDSNSGTFDYHLSQIMDYDSYAGIALKNLRSLPSAYFYAPEYPLGKLYVYPIPSAQFEIHIVTNKLCGNNIGLNDVLSMPSEYADALMWNLAARIAPMFGQEASQTVAMLAMSSIDDMRKANITLPALKTAVDGYNQRWGSTINAAAFMGGVF